MPSELEIGLEPKGSIDDTVYGGSARQCGADEVYGDADKRAEDRRLRWRCLQTAETGARAARSVIRTAADRWLKS